MYNPSGYISPGKLLKEMYNLVGSMICLKNS